VPLYIRGKAADGSDSPFAQVFVILVQSRNRPEYVPQVPGATYSDVTAPTQLAPEPWSTLEPRKVDKDVSLRYNYTTLRGEMTIGLTGRHLAATGAYVIIADDRNKTKLPKKTDGQSNGRIYRLGNPIDEGNGIWELSPDGDMIRSDTTNASNVQAGDDNDLDPTDTDVYIIGRGYIDPLNKPAPGDPLYSGPAQDIGIYTGFIRIKDAGITTGGTP
jgi:hypothetical protein